MNNNRLIVLTTAAWLFLPPLLLPSATARAQGPVFQIMAPKIERFDVDPPKRLLPGEALIFRITGTSRGDASVRIGGVKGKIALREVIPGIYEGAYTIRPGDEIVSDSLVIGYLRRGTQDISAVLGQPLVENSRVALAR